MLLNELTYGVKARLVGFTESGMAHQVRYLSLGLLPGTNLELLRAAPLGCPLQIKVGSTLLSIRKAEAAELVVEVVQ